MNIATHIKVLLGVVVITLAACSFDTMRSPGPDSAAASLAQGQRTFRFDTFGDETFWTDTLRMHEVIAKAVDPTTALSVGLKVDAEALPPAVVEGIKNGSISL